MFCLLRARRLEEVLIAVPRSAYDRLVARLVSESLFHVEEPLKELPGASTSRFKLAYAQASEKFSKIQSYYAALKVQPILREGVEVVVSDWVSSFNEYLERYRELDRFFDVRVSRLAEIESAVAELRRLKELLEPVKHVDVDIRVLAESARMQYALGIAPRDIVEYVVELTEKHGLVSVVERVDERTVLVGVAGRPESMRFVVPSLVKRGLSIIAIPRELPGRPSEAYKTVVEGLDKLVGEASRIRGELMERVEELHNYYTYMYAFREAFKVLAYSLESKTSMFIRGYVDVSDFNKLTSIVEEETEGAYIVYRLGIRRGEVRVPTRISLPWFLQPFHKIVQLYGEPKPEEVIPTIFLAITFPIAFGLMFPDAGHGLVLVLFALLYLRRRSPDWAFILAILGSTSIVTGLLAGEVFGPKVSELLHVSSIWGLLGLHVPPLALPTYAVEHGLNELVGELLYRAITISLWVAAFMLILGTLLGVVNSYLAGEREEMVAVKIPKFLFFTSATLPFLILFDAKRAGATLGLALLELGGGDMLATIVLAGITVSLTWLLLGEPLISALHGHNPLSGMARSFMEVYESILMAMGNIPSFLRIMALALAHSSVMFAFAYIFDLLASWGPIGLIAGALVYIVGNLMVIALEGILAFAQSLRLHFYEWFSKFYAGGGIPFTPISIPGVRIVFTGTQ
ncbi:MAG: V-type ATP synthase subunit I [Acidilobaceae archaeon]